jgi:DNA-directed RNA polymerase specialized sigma24 family protein
VSGVPQAEPVRGISAFDDFYRSHYRQTVRLTYALLGWTDSAEDIVQEAFSRVWERFATVENPGGFLRVTVVNLCS